MYERFQAEVDSCKYERRRGVHWLDGYEDRTGVSQKVVLQSSAREAGSMALLPA